MIKYNALRLLAFGLLAGGVLFSLPAQELRLKEVYRETAAPVLADVLVEPDRGVEALLAPLPSLGNKPGFFTLGWLRERTSLPPGFAFVSGGFVFLPNGGLREEEAEFVTALVRFLAEQREDTEVCFWLEGVDLPRSLPAEPEFRIQGGSKKMGMYSGRIQVQAKAPAESWKRDGSLGVTVRVAALVPVLKRDVKNRDTILPEDWAWKYRELANITGNPAPAADLEDKLSALRQMYRDEILRQGSYKVVLPVNVMDSINILVTRGAVAVEVPGIAQEAGRLGQKIRVRLKAGQVIEAEVTGDKEVRAELP